MAKFAKIVSQLDFSNETEEKVSNSLQLDLFFILLFIFYTD